MLEVTVLFLTIYVVGLLSCAVVHFVRKNDDQKIIPIIPEKNAVKRVGLPRNLKSKKNGRR